MGVEQPCVEVEVDRAAWPAGMPLAPAPACTENPTAASANHRSGGRSAVGFAADPGRTLAERSGMNSDLPLCPVIERGEWLNSRMPHVSILRCRRKIGFNRVKKDRENAKSRMRWSRVATGGVPISSGRARNEERAVNGTRMTAIGIASSVRGGLECVACSVWGSCSV